MLDLKKGGEIINMTYMEKRSDISNDPSASPWLKNAMRELEHRDNIDALVDVKILEQLLKLKMEELSARASI